MIVSEKISLQTQGFSYIVDITPRVTAIVEGAKMKDGAVTVFCAGSTGAVTTIEYESGVLEDLKKAIERIAPSDVPYAHDRRWGDGNGYAHLRSALVGTARSFPVIDGRIGTGTWQQIVLCDFDNRARDRQVLVTVVGE